MRITKVTIDVPDSVSERLISGERAKDPRLQGFIEAALSIAETSAGTQTNLEGVADRCVAYIEKICHCFHRIAKQLKQRRKGRPTIKIADEYDVQYLLHGLLVMEFDNVDKEVWTPSYAGGASRMDFLLKPQLTVVETKMPRASLSTRALGEELIIDIAKYREHPHCKNLVCFVYDPDSRVTNPRGVEHDLSRDHDGLRVRVVIAPKY